MKSFLLIFCTFLIFSSCQPSILSKLHGTWKMQQVYDNSNNVTTQHNPAKDRWITFLPNGSFKSDGQPYGKNTGKWIYNKTENHLFLDSDAGEGDDSHWQIQIDKDSMNWAGAKSSFTERFRISFSKRQ